MNWGSVADWLTVLVAAPAAALFLVDRYRSRAERLRVYAKRLDDNTFATFIEYRPADLTRGIAAKIEGIEPSGLQFAPEGDLGSGATKLQPALVVRLDLKGELLHSRVLAHSPSGRLVSARVKVSLIKIPGKRSFTSRKSKLSAIS